MRATTQLQDGYLRLGVGVAYLWRAALLHVLARGGPIAIRYRVESIRPRVRPYAGVVGPAFLLIQDNARFHVAGLCQLFLQEGGIDAMDWPARSPDMNPNCTHLGQGDSLHPPTQGYTTYGPKNSPANNSQKLEFA